MSGDFKIQDKESQLAVDKVEELIEDAGGLPYLLYISDTEELQSLMMWYCMSLGIKTERHPSRTYIGEQDDG